MTKQTTVDRARAVLALSALLATAQSPAPAATPVPWCDAVPLPRADLPSLTSNVDTQTIHHSRPLTCRPLDVRGPAVTLHLALAATEGQREKGLMGVPFVPAGQGMLFAFPDGVDRRRSFWMKNTVAALDMLFVNGDGTIATIAADVPATAPGTPDEKVARRDGVARFVIELGAGEAARIGLRPGMRLVIPAVPAR